MRILVLRGGALGDFLVTIPALRLLRNRWPGAQIELVGNARAAELGLVGGLLDSVHSQHEVRWSALYDGAPLRPEFAHWLGRFDLVISFWSDLDGALRRHFPQKPGDFIASGPKVSTKPAAKHFCDALAPLGLMTADYVARLDLSASVQAEADQRLGDFRDFVAYHPGSGSPKKNWPAGRWAELAARLGQPALAISGEAEQTDILWPEDLFVQRAHEWPLPLLAGALRRCSRYFGHDTGISHLAAAVGAESVLLFGPTDPETWAPPGEHVRVVKSGADLASIRVSDVVKAIQPTRKARF
ncbi:hypothetical protein DB347_08550 [Opitutaceae bacterium EW11]|nr:hypothetical protein DB347_08550 [Opitutaceae bacterium EW11]